MIEQVKPAVVYVVCIVDGKLKLPKPSKKGLPTKRYVTQNVKLGSAGSGFVVDPDGYIVTNGHVVFSFTHSNVQDDLYVRQLLLEKAAEELGIPLEYVAGHGKIDTTIRKIFVQFGESTSGFDIRRKATPARTVGNPSPSSEKDIAVIKVDLPNLSSVELGKSEGAEVGDRIYVIGYPGPVMNHPYLSEETGLEPTVTSGIIGAKRKTRDGSLCLQTDATITHGNSGGPAIDEGGKVIGVATFGSMGKTGEVHGYNFLRPSELVEEFLVETGVRNIEVLRRVDVLSKQIGGTKQLALILGDHGKYKIERCEHNVKNYCERWTWNTPEDWAEFKKVGKIYRLKAFPEYCGPCDSFKEKGDVSADKKVDTLASSIETCNKKVDALVKFIVNHGKFKFEQCLHNEKNFCTYWSWEKEPTWFASLAGKKLEGKKNPQGWYIMEASATYCATCPCFERKST